MEKDQNTETENKINKEDREDCGNIWLSSIQDFITQLYNV